jgi:hypothetical protein
MNAFDPTRPGPAHHRWARSPESPEFFVDEDRLRAAFYAILGGGVLLLGSLAFGLWRLQAAALSAPVVIGIAHDLVFTGRPETLASVRDRDFAAQLSDTVEVLFGRTEKGLPPAIKDFATPEVLRGIDQAYGEASAKYPAGYAQTLAILGAKVVESRTGYQRVRYRGLLSSRSLSAAQMSPIYLDCTFVIGPPTARNATGWRLTRIAALARDDYYAEERDQAARDALQLPHRSAP